MSSSAAAARDETGTTRAAVPAGCPPLSSKTDATACRQSPTIAIHAEPTEATMCRRGDRPVAVGDWGYPGYLTRHEWEVFVSFSKKLSTSRCQHCNTYYFSHIRHALSLLFSAATIQSRGGTPPTRVSIDRVQLCGRGRGSIVRLMPVAPGAQIPPVPGPHNGRRGDRMPSGARPTRLLLRRPRGPRRRTVRVPRAVSADVLRLRRRGPSAVHLASRPAQRRRRELRHDDGWDIALPLARHDAQLCQTS